MPSLIPTDPHDPDGPKHITLSKHINGQPLKEQGESSLGVQPRQPNLPNPMLSTIDSRRTGMEKRLELTTIQMTPSPLGNMIVKRNQGFTLWTRPTQIPGMIGPYIHLLIDQIQLNSFHRPRWLYPKKITVKFNVFHGSSHPWSHFTLTDYPRKSWGELLKTI